MKIQSFPQCTLEKFIQRHAFSHSFKTRTITAKNIPFSISAKRIQFFVFPYFFDNSVINSFRRHIMQRFIIQQSFRWHFTDFHLIQPVINDIITSHIPQIRISAMTTFVVLQPCMKIFMRQNKHPLFFGQLARWIDVDDAFFCIHCRYMYLIFMT